MSPDTTIPASSTSSTVDGVSATSGGLLKATLGAAAAAGAILTFVWLPAEYGIDPTGVGKVLGLTEMGQIKRQLHAEAEAEADANVSANAVVDDINSNSDVMRKLDAIQAQLAVIAATLSTTAATGNADQVAAQASLLWRDKVDYTLVPGQGIEVKLVMDKGAVADYEWSANGSVLNHDTHGDGNGQNISYEQGRAVAGKAGQLTAAFSGNHGWFWRNRTDQAVVVTVQTRGDYKDMVLP